MNQKITESINMIQALERLVRSENNFNDVYEKRRNELGYWMSYNDLYEKDRDVVINFYKTNLQGIKYDT